MTHETTPNPITMSAFAASKPPHPTHPKRRSHFMEWRSQLLGVACWQRRAMPWDEEGGGEHGHGGTNATFFAPIASKPWLALPINRSAPGVEWSWVRRAGLRCGCEVASLKPRPHRTSHLGHLILP